MRAAASIESGHCLVRNAWLERAWSPFPGHTLRLADMRRDQDWVTQAAPDLSIRLDNAALATSDLNNIEWGEERCALGAVLVCKRMWPGVVVVTRDLAYDDHPALQRFISVLSLLPRPVALEAPVLDALRVDATDITLRWDGFQAAGNEYAGESTERGIALDRGHAGLILGAYNGSHYDCFTTDPSVCALGRAEPYIIEPGSLVRLPSTYLLAYTGALADASRTVYADFLAQVRKEHKARTNGQGEPYD